MSKFKSPFVLGAIALLGTISALGTHMDVLLSKLRQILVNHNILNERITDYMP